MPSKTKKASSASRTKRASKKSSRKTSRKKSQSKKQKINFSLKKLMLQLSLVGIVLIGGLMWYFNARITTEFIGLKFDNPAQVYGRPLELYSGLNLSAEELEKELLRLGYRTAIPPRREGEYLATGQTIDIHIRSFDHWDGEDPGGFVRIDFKGDQISQVRSATAKPLVMVRLDPLLIGNIFPQQQQDRISVTLDEVPNTLKAGLLAVEDRGFYHHWGVSLSGIFRALIANIKAGGIAQGGSTLTQQLVKNLYLDKSRSIVRKAKEAIMALLVEFHYSKSEILRGYINEVYLAQDGSRAVHGFGLASLEFFGAPLIELQIHQQALLVGMIKGPNLYNPFRNPERAKARRNLVLDIWAEQGVIDEEDAQWAKSRSLDVRTGVRRLRYPHFLDLVQRQLKAQYRSADLLTQGLKIHTSLDPRVQQHTEESLAEKLPELESRYQLKPGLLQGAIIVSQPDTGEVLALVGDRNVRFVGYNRALDARRPVGSLLKPAVTLSALEQGYSLAHQVSDGPVVVEGKDGSRWEPANFDETSHGKVSVQTALSKSYNQATARLGMEVGLQNVLGTIERLGLADDLPPYPSVMLGAAETSPLKVAEMYGTFAANGFRTAPRAIRAVTNSENQLVQSFDLSFKQVVQPVDMFLLQKALQNVMSEGTGKYAYFHLDSALNLSGKTGTTDDQRDSWFAGYTGDYLSVVWLGRDDNGTTPLTGSSGALRVWTDIMSRIRPQAYLEREPANIEWHWVEKKTGLISGKGCPDVIRMPFEVGVVTDTSKTCGPSKKPIKNWIKKFFGRQGE